MEYTIGTKVFKDWEIAARIGEGAYGEVFQVRKSNYGITTKSALKVIRIPRSPADVQVFPNQDRNDPSIARFFEDIVEKFAHEIAIMADLKNHPNVVGCEDYEVIRHTDELGWDILIRMPLLTPLRDRQKQKPLDEAEVRQLGCDLCEALILCHKRGLIHRDIKPGNIFVDDLGHFRLGDFGVAHTVAQTRGYMSKQGTESYMAPELYHNESGRENVDICSLGLVLYQLMNCNRLPFYPLPPEPITYSIPIQALNRRMADEALPPPCHASAEFSALILQACAYDPAVRFRSAADMLRALRALPPETCRATRAVPERAAPPAQPAKKQRKRGRAGVFAVLAVLALAAVGLMAGDMFSGGGSSLPPAPTASPRADEPDAVSLSEVQTLENGARAEIYTNAEGLELRRVLYDRDGRTEMYFLAEYDENGQLIRQTRHEADGELFSVIERDYNENGKLTGHRSLSSDGALLSLTEYVYNENGHLTTLYEQSGNGELISRTEYTRNANGDALTQIGYLRDGSVEYTAEYTYNAAGTRTGARQDNADGSFSLSLYDADGRRTQLLIYDETGIPQSKYTYTYNEAGQSTQSLFYEYDAAQNESLRTLRTCRRDEDGNILRSETLEPDGSPRYRYENLYDILGQPAKEYWYFASDSSCLETTYDGDARNLEQIDYDADGTVISTRTYSYDGAGNLLREDIYNADGSDRGFTDYSYDEQGKCTGIHSLYLYDDGSWSEDFMDGDWNSLFYASYDADGSLRSRSEYSYDETGNLTGIYNVFLYDDGSRSEDFMDGNWNVLSHTRYNADETVRDWTEYIYDAAGRQIRELRYGSDDTLLDRTEYRYDTAGNRIESIYYHGDDSLDFRMTYTYDAAGNQISATHYDSDNELLYWTETEYDENGNEQIETHYRADGTVDYWYEYVYDGNGNFSDLIRHEPS